MATIRVVHPMLGSVAPRPASFRLSHAPSSRLPNVPTGHAGSCSVRPQASTRRFPPRIKERLGVNQLLSPPRLPQYNGACEAAIGWMKSPTRWIAAQDGRIGLWTSDDLEAARILANECRW